MGIAALEHYDAPAKFLRAFFDGSVRDQHVGFGWVVFATEDVQTDRLSEWRVIATRSGTLPKGTTITAAELEGASGVISFLAAYLKGHCEVSKTSPSTPR